MLRTASSVIASVVIVLFAASWSPPARAVVVNGSFSGQIFSGFDFGTDPAGYFGAGFDLDGLPITGTFSYDTLEVPPPSSSGANFAVYSDPSFATDFLSFTISINGRSYSFGMFPANPGIQSIEVIDNTDQLLFDYQRFGADASESLALRFISDIDFLVGTGIPTRFDFIASGEGLTPVGSFSFDLPNGDFVSARFEVDRASAPAAVPEPSTLSTVVLGLLGIGTVFRRRASRRHAALG